MAAEYEVNIKINSQEIERELGKIDRTVAQIGKPKGRSKRSGVLMDDAELKRLQNAGIYLGQAVQRTDTLARAQDKRARLMNRINELEAKGVSVSRLRQQMGKATKQLADKNFGLLEKEFRLLERSVRLEESKLRIKRSQAAADRDRARFLAGADVGRGQFGPVAPAVQGPRQMIASPIGGATTIPGSPAFLRRQQRIKTLEQVGLGAGFPLLFGGGAGSILGGGLGGLTGSFGAQIAFSAIGQQIDQFIAGITEAAKAFSSLEGVLTLMSERSLFTSKSSEDLAQQLENLGDVEALAELATIELASKIGSDGIQAFQDLETELDEFDRLVGHLMISLQAFLAGPLGNFLEIVNATLGKEVTQGTIDRLAGSLQDPADRTRFRAAAKERIGTELEIQGFGMGGLPRSAEVLKSAPLDLLSELSRDVAEGKFGESNLLSRPLKITGQDRETFKPKKDSAANDEERLQKRLNRLEEERKKVLEISRFRDQIAAAEAVGDDELVIRLQGEQQIAEIEASRLKALVGVTKQHERDAINIGKATEKLAAHRDTERELNALQATRAEANEKVISGLEDQNALLQAKLNGNLEEVQLEQEVSNILEKNVALDKERVRSLLEARNALNEQIKVAENLDMIYDQIGQSIANGVVGTLSAAVDQTKSLAEAAGNALRNIANVLLQLGTNTLLTSTGLPIFANLKGFANGGSPPVGRPSIVGERGPELFVPKSAGTIVPNHALGGANVVVNVDASGTQAQGNQPNAKALGAAIGAAVQAELVKQKRPGGLLS